MRSKDFFWDLVQYYFGIFGYDFFSKLYILAEDYSKSIFAIMCVLFIFSLTWYFRNRD